MERQPGLIICERDQVMHLRLVRQHEVSHYIAVISEVRGVVEAAGGSKPVELFRTVFVLNDSVAHVRLMADGAGNVPSAPAFLKRAILPGDERCGVGSLGT